MSNDDITVAVLREIRDEVRTTNELARATNAELLELKTEVREFKTHTITELRVIGTTLEEHAAQMLLLSRYVKNSTTRQGREIDELRGRVDELESNVPK